MNALNSLSKGNTDLSDLLFQAISYNDYHGDYYHVFHAGIFVSMGYEVESNKEHSLGRPDIRLIDWKNRQALIIEAKKYKQKESMEHDCVEALNQIVKQEYTEDLDGLEVFRYAIAFHRKSAKVKKLRI